MPTDDQDVRRSVFHTKASASLVSEVNELDQRDPVHTEVINGGWWNLNYDVFHFADNPFTHVVGVMADGTVTIWKPGTKTHSMSVPVEKPTAKFDPPNSLAGYPPMPSAAPGIIPPAELPVKLPTQGEYEDGNQTSLLPYGGEPCGDLDDDYDWSNEIPLEPGDDGYEGDGAGPRGPG